MVIGEAQARPCDESSAPRVFGMPRADFARRSTVRQVAAPGRSAAICGRSSSVAATEPTTGHARPAPVQPAIDTLHGPPAYAAHPAERVGQTSERAIAKRVYCNNTSTVTGRQTRTRDLSGSRRTNRAPRTEQGPAPPQPRTLLRAPEALRRARYRRRDGADGRIARYVTFDNCRSARRAELRASDRQTRYQHTTTLQV